MTTTYRFMLCALTVAVAAGALLAQAPAQPRTSGRVLILRNHRTLEGEIERVGDQFHIRRAAGEMWIRAAEALCLCADWDDAFALLARQANLRDPDERVRLAKWCAHNGLRQHALEEIAAALRLQPNHKAAKQFQATLENTTDARSAPPLPSPVEMAPVVPVDLGSESLALFTARVQPILMNACASCHATGRGGNFKLTRCHDAAINRRGLHQNLTAILEHIDLEEPAASPLLYKAFSAHGGATNAPLAQRSVPYRTLHDWVGMVVRHNPHLRRLRTAKAPSVPPAPARSQRLLGKGEGEAPAEPHAADKAGSAQPGPAAVSQGTEFGAEPRPVVPGSTTPAGANAASPAASPAATRAARPITQATAADEFDPALFNRQLHPQR
jgi:hypothetical protein